MDIAGSICVVTGATEGIGKAIALALGKKGAKVAICARNGKQVDRTVDELRGLGITAAGRAADVASEADVLKFAELVHAELGPADVLVNNAGLGHFARVEKLTPAQFNEMMAVNVGGIFLVTRAFLPDMRKKQAGDIVNVASLAGRNALVEGTGYAASKHAVLGFSKSLMLEVRKDNIRVLAICPGSVVTPFFEKAGQELPNPERVLTPENVAQAIIAALEIPRGAMISELDIRPTNP